MKVERSGLCGHGRLSDLTRPLSSLLQGFLTSESVTLISSWEGSETVPGPVLANHIFVSFLRITQGAAAYCFGYRVLALEKE